MINDKSLVVDSVNSEILTLFPVAEQLKEVVPTDSNATILDMVTENELATYDSIKSDSKQIVWEFALGGCGLLFSAYLLFTGAVSLPVGIVFALISLFNIAVTRRGYVTETMRKSLLWNYVMMQVIHQAVILDLKKSVNDSNGDEQFDFDTAHSKAKVKAVAVINYGVDLLKKEYDEFE